MALLDRESDTEVDEEDLDDIFYPGSDEEGFVLKEEGDEECSEASDTDQEGPQDNPGDLNR